MKTSRWIAAWCIASLALFAFSFPAVAGDRPELTDELVAQIQRETVPMPFPDISRAVLTDEPTRMVYKYNRAERPPLTEAYGEELFPPPAQSPKSGGPTRITNTEQFPYSSVVHLYMRYGDGYAGCSGAFIHGTSTVLTAGHCIYNHDMGGYPDDIIVMPAQDGNDMPFGQKYAYNWATNNRWISYQDYRSDYAVIVVSPFGGTGYMDSAYSTSNSWYATREFQTAGYPGDYGYNGEEMWWEESDVDELDSSMLRVDYHFGDDYPYYCIPGQSGSAIYLNEGGTWSITAVLTLGSCHGVRVDDEIDAFVRNFDCPGCLIDDTCYEDGDLNPNTVCRICDPDLDDSGWSPNNGRSCNDGEFCNGDDTCQGGTCSVHEGDPCDADETCKETTDQCLPGDTTDDDDDDDDTDGDDNDEPFCEDTVALVYNQCGIKFAIDGKRVLADLVYQWCLDGNTQWDWNCLDECKQHDKVDDCQSLGNCLESLCDVELYGSDSGGDDDDDDNSFLWGCG